MVKKRKKQRKVKRSKTKTAGKKERIPSGIKNFDNLVEGGFEKNSVNLIVGTSGSGKTIFAMQFLIEGLKRGENCLYVTFEEKRDEFFKNMLRFGWNLEEYEKKGNFTFLEYTPEKVRTMLEEGGGTVEAIVLKKKISRMVIDSITSFMLLFQSEIEKRESALKLFDILRKWQCTCLLTLEEDPSEKAMHETTAQSIEFEVDSIVLLYFIRRKLRRQRFLEVLKMRGTSHSTLVYPVIIDKSGFYIINKPQPDHF